MNTDRIQQLRRLARFTTIAFWIYGAFSVLKLYSDALLIAYAVGDTGPINPNTEEFVGVSAFRSLTILVYFLPYLLVGILFLRWFYVAYSNLAQLGMHEPRYSNGWTVFGFIIPFLNFVRPYQVMRELWDQLDLAARNNFATLNLPKMQSRNVNRWWTLYLSMLIPGSVGDQFANRATTYNGLLFGSLLIFAATLLTFPAIVAAIRLIRFTTDYEAALLPHFFDLPGAVAASASAPEPAPPSVQDGSTVNHSQLTVHN